MRFLMFLAIFFTFVFSVNAQSDKYLEVVYSTLDIYQPTVLGSNNIRSIDSVANGSVSDAQQIDNSIRSNSENQPRGSLSIMFKNLTQKKIRSVSFIFRATLDGKKFFERNVKNKSGRSKDSYFIINESFLSVLNQSVKHPKLVREVIIKQVVFEDGQKIKF